MFPKCREKLRQTIAQALKFYQLWLNLVRFGSVRLVIEQEFFIYFRLCHKFGKNRFSNADRQKPISDSYSTSHNTWNTKKVLFGRH